MKARNQVIAGDYLNKKIFCTPSRGFYIAINFSGTQRAVMNKETVESYELITGESQKSAASGVMRGAVGAALLGPVGLLAGVSAKSNSVYTVAVKFKDGKNSLLELGAKEYQQLVQHCF